MKSKLCKHCGNTNHTSFNCFLKNRKLMKPEATKTRQRRTDLKWQWIEANPAPWQCYLKISPICPINLTLETMVLEHVKPRAKYPGLKYELSNIRPSCGFCNRIKGGLELHRLAEIYPELLPLLDTL